MKTRVREKLGCRRVFSSWSILDHLAPLFANDGDSSESAVGLAFDSENRHTFGWPRSHVFLVSECVHGS